jgi:cytochrome c-type biogenesis protein CcmI
MMLFWLICAGLAAIALAFVLPTLLQRAEANNENNKTEANVEIYRDQLRELEADLANGIVGPEQYRQDRDEIERRLLDDVADSSELRKKGYFRGAVWRASSGRNHRERGRSAHDATRNRSERCRPGETPGAKPQRR